MNRTFILRNETFVQAVISFISSNAPAMAAQGKPMAVTVSESKSRRSVDQNKRYWALLQEIAAGAWVEGKQYSADAWHENFKREFIGYEDIPNGGKAGISTTTLDVAAFTEYMDRISDYAQDHLAIEFAL